MLSQVRPTEVRVDLGALTHNLRIARQYAGAAAVCAVVKADGYGHGAAAVAQHLAKAGVDCFGVALVEEGVALRQAGITQPVWVWGSAMAGAMATMVQQHLTPVLSYPAQIAELAQVPRQQSVGVHIEVDTGMARLGVCPTDLGPLLDALQQCPNVHLEGLMSHMAVADLAGESFNTLQVQRFAAATEQVTRAGCKPTWLHFANSPALVSLPLHPTNMVRCGLLLYGLEPMRNRTTAALRPALSWHTRIVGLRHIPVGTPVSYGCSWRAPRDSYIATVAVGYADGYVRRLSNRAHMLVRGQRAPVVGTICMDMCMLDITDISGVALGDAVSIVGTQGKQTIGVADLALWAETIPYEIICGIGKRVPRFYEQEPQSKEQP